MTNPSTVLVPPDGGYGWIIVLGVALVQLCARSMEQCFGLVFGDMLDNLGVKTTGATVITSTMDILINFSGIFTGPLIRIFAYRKVTFLGGLCVGMGLILTTFATSVSHIIITYGVINGLGAGLTTSATFVALNRYFVKKRGRAFGYSMSGSALGMILIPQLAHVLLQEYGFRGTILIMGAISLHAIVGACLLQPAEWHYIPLPQEEEAQKKKMETIQEEGDDDEAEAQTKKLLKQDLGEVPKPTTDNSFKDLDHFQNKFRKSASTKSFEGSKVNSCASEKDLSEIGKMDLTGSSTFLNFESAEDLKTVTRTAYKRHHSVPNFRSLRPPDVIQKPPIEVKAPKEKESIWTKIYKFMDFDILKDPIYVNLVVGLSLFYTSEGNYKTVTPFYFRSLGYEQKDVAFFLSIQSLTDIFARLALPAAFDKLNVKKRTIFWIGIFALGTSRTMLALQSSWIYLVVWLVIAGFVRGLVFVNFLITIAEYVPIEKLPSAMGLHMVIRGIFVICLGPALGYVRDITGSYQICIFSQTFLLFIAFVAWGIEFLKHRKPKAVPAVDKV